MRKIIYISVLLMTFFYAAQAQKKIIYEDTSLLQKEEPVIAAPVEEPGETTSSENTGSNETTTAVEEKADTVLYQNNLRLPYDSIKQWQNLKEYAYMKYIDSLLRNEKKAEAPPPVSSPAPGILNSILSSGFVSVLLWGAAIFFVLFIVYRLFLAEGVFQRKTKSLVTAETEVDEEITAESDFAALIRTALQNGNYRQAVRYQYLRTLHSLADKHFIELAPDKTNFQYVHEIKNRDHQQAFASLTLNYEYVWYGEFAIEQNIYQKIETGFNNLNQKL